MQATQPFLAEILSAPESDEPRKRYADWLDLECNPRGEFIRVQLLLARLPEYDSRIIELETRERELLAECEDEWAADIAGYVDWYVFRRGFIEEVSLSVPQFVFHSKEMFRKAPIRVVHLTEARDDLKSLASCPQLGRTRHLDLSNNPVRESGMRSLATSPNIAGLRGLNLSCTGLGDGGARAVAESPQLGQVEELYLSNNRISNSGGQALAQTPHLNRIRMLFLKDNYLDAHSEQALYRKYGSRVHF